MAKIKVTQVKSSNGRIAAQKASLRGLGLRRIGHTVELEDTPAIRGMIGKVYFMVQVEGA
jgi:large subunit ribosomal protein L30